MNPRFAMGAHLEVERAGGLYYHHGIYVGRGWVIHFAGEPGGDKCGAEVREDSLEAFAMGAPVYDVRHHAAAPARVVVDRARSCLGEGGYDLVHNNCEHFATWCKTGRAHSTQVEARTSQFGALAGGLATGSGALGLAAIGAGGMPKEQSSYGHPSPALLGAATLLGPVGVLGELGLLARQFFK